jgi:cell division septation protein DedD
MNQNDSPNPTDIGGEILAPENVNALVYVSPKPERKVETVVAPDPFAVGVRVLRMAPAWLLSMTAGCSLLIILLGWMNPSGMANTVAYAPALNDARPAQAVPAPTATQPAAPAQPAQATEPAAVPGKAASAPESVPAPAAPAPEAPAKQESAAPATPAPAQAEVKAQAESPAQSADAAGNFTVQVGSFNHSSEANERVSSLRNGGFEARAVAVELPGRGTWYRVQVGRFADRAEASKAATSLRAKGAAAAIVVPIQN